MLVKCRKPMAPHLSLQERKFIRSKCRRTVMPPQIVKLVRARRRLQGRKGPSRSTVYRFINRDTFNETIENRGRPQELRRQVLRIVNAQRKCLFKKAGTQHVVTWGDICKASARVLRTNGILKRSQPMWSEQAVRKDFSVVTGWVVVCSGGR